MNKRLKNKKQRRQEEVPVTAAAEPCATLDVNFYIQYHEKEYLEDEIISKVTDQCLADGITPEQLRSLSIYFKPEDQKAYYVVEDCGNGSVDL